MTSALRSSERVPLLQVVKSAVATIAAWLLAGWLIPGTLPVFAAIAALLVVQPSVNQSLSKAIERSIGVVIGVVIALALLLLLPGQSWIILAAIVIALLLAWAMRANPAASAQFAISAVLVLALGGSDPAYAIDRIVETLIGAAIGLVVNVLVVPPVRVEPARQALEQLGRGVAATLDRLAEALVTAQTPAQLRTLLEKARELRPIDAAADAAIAAAEESLALNPRGAKHRVALAEMRVLFGRLHPMVMQALGMTRAFVDHYDDALADDPAARAIAEQLRRAGHDVRLTVQQADVVTDPEALTSSIPALTAPLVLAPPSSGHWILIGSLMEDLRRIRGELSDEF